MSADIERLLDYLARLPNNRTCADCGSKAPKWASVSLGVFICFECSGVHRKMGVGISYVKSINLDSWTSEQVSVMRDIGNLRSNNYYEGCPEKCVGWMNAPDSECPRTAYGSQENLTGDHKLLNQQSDRIHVSGCQIDVQTTQGISGVSTVLSGNPTAEEFYRPSKINDGVKLLEKFIMMKYTKKMFCNKNFSSPRKSRATGYSLTVYDSPISSVSRQYQERSDESIESNVIKKISQISEDFVYATKSPVNQGITSQIDAPNKVRGDDRSNNQLQKTDRSCEKLRRNNEFDLFSYFQSPVSSTKTSIASASCAFSVDFSSPDGGDPATIDKYSVRHEGLNDEKNSGEVYGSRNAQYLGLLSGDLCNGELVSQSHLLISGNPMTGNRNRNIGDKVTPSLGDNNNGVCRSFSSDDSEYHVHCRECE